MTDFSLLDKSLHPLWTALVACLALIIMSQIWFSQARNISVPPAPELLHAERVRLDHVQHTREPAGPSGESLRTMVSVHLAQSDDWPGITFRFEGAASGISITPPQTFDLYLAKSLAEAAEIRQQRPNVSPTLVVYGVSDGAGVSIDPAIGHAAAVDRQNQLRLLGWAAFGLAILPAYFAFRTGRRLWRDHMA